MSERFSRQADIVNQNLLDIPIVIVGAGSVGSWSALALAKMGCADITIIDPDQVGMENVGAQVYGINDVGKNKVDAVAEKIKTELDEDIKCYVCKGEDILPTIPKVILVLALDSIESRKKCLLANKTSTPAFVIDIRMKAELISAYLAFDEKSSKNYYKSLENNVKIDKGKCSEKNIIYNTFFCAGLVANLVKKIAHKEKLPRSLIIDLKELKIY